MRGPAGGPSRVRYVAPGDEHAWEQAWAEKPRMVWLETPSNPLLRVVDIERLSTRARREGALTVVDNTFLSPVWQQPISLGADVVVHSTTKYLNGHSDVVGGAVISASDTLHQDVAWWANALGVTGSPFDSYQTLRGLRTLHARMPLHEQNAMALLEELTAHPAVSRVPSPESAYAPGSRDCTATAIRIRSHHQLRAEGQGGGPYGPSWKGVAASRWPSPSGGSRASWPTPAR